MLVWCYFAYIVGNDVSWHWVSLIALCWGPVTSHSLEARTPLLQQWSFCFSYFAFYIGISLSTLNCVKLTFSSSKLKHSLPPASSMLFSIQGLLMTFALRALTIILCALSLPVPTWQKSLDGLVIGADLLNFLCWISLDVAIQPPRPALSTYLVVLLGGLSRFHCHYSFILIWILFSISCYYPSCWTFSHFIIGRDSYLSSSISLNFVWKTFIWLPKLVDS